MSAGEATGLYLVKDENTVRTANATTAGFSLSTGRIPELDGLRGVAILMVIFHHIRLDIVAAPGSLVSYATIPLRLGWSGVDLFFVLSGFLIGGILIDNRESRNYFKVFYARRVLRIFPLYFAVLLIYVVLSQIRPVVDFFTDLFNNPLPLWTYFLYLQNWMMAFKRATGAGWLVVTWSLAIEEQFYLILPAIVYFLRKRPLVVFLIVVAVSSVVLRLLLYRYSHGVVYVLTPTRADSLMMGVLCAIALRTKSITDLLVARRTLVYVLWSIFLAGFAFISYHGEIFGRFDVTPFTYFWLSVFYSLTLVLAMTDRSSSIIRKLLRMRWLQRTGGIAYGLYLMHPIVISVVLYLYKGDKLLRTPADGFVMALAILITFVVAEVSWRWFEKPLVRIGRRYEYSNRVLAVSAP